MANTTTANLGLPLVDDDTTLFELWRKGINGNNAGSASEPYSLAQIIDAWAATVAKKPTRESFTVANWGALSDKSPFTHSATVIADTDIDVDTNVELINDNAVLFGTYGFAIGAVSGQTITIYSVGAPSSSVTLKVDIGG